MAKDRWVDFRVRMLVPAEATIEDARSYIEGAVYTWRGLLRPPGAHGPDDDGDPMHYFDSDKLKVTRLIRPRRGRTGKR
jgi:hypothetical protein